MSSSFRRALAPALTFACALALVASAADARPNRRPASVMPAPPSHRVAFMGYLRDGRTVTVYDDARAEIAASRTAPLATGPRGPRGTRTALVDALRAVHAPRPAPARVIQLAAARYGPLDGDVDPGVRRQILFDLEHPPQRYVPGRVLVVFKPGVTIAQDRVELTPSAAATLRQAVLAKRRDVTPHPFTADVRTNLTLMNLGVDRADRLFSGVDRATLGAMRGRAEARTRRSLVAFDNAFVLHVGAASVESAVRALRAAPSVAYAAPDLAVTPMIAARRPIPADAQRELSSYRRAPHTFGRATRSTAPSAIPGNTAVSFNLQALLDAPGVDAIAPFDEIGQRFGQLPGTGEIVTNVGIGDVDDASAATNPNDPCYPAVRNGGVTTHVIGGQRYLDMPSMPLIPVWVADPSGTLSTTNDVCDVDPGLSEVGLDFSVMAPLPDGLQRPGEVASFGTDLLGIAPGATYRWVAPGATKGVVGESDTLGAFIGAARQQPAPNVITASLGFGADFYGFPGRYLEEDPLAQSVVAGIVSANIVVCISANDGTRMFTVAAVGPSGGSAPTNADTTDPTTVNDLYDTTAASVVPDSGAIDVGSSTLDDVFSANPQDRASGALANVPAFTETRYNGTLGFSSGFGSRVNLSAPGDNVQAFYRSGLAYDAAALEIVSGTSASAPEVAAAAAVALQVARLTGRPFTSATQVRDALVATGTPVANPPQSDVVANVGPQVSVRRIVEQLLAAAGKPVQPAVARVAVHGRRSGSFIAQLGTRYLNDAVFVSALDPAYIKLDGPFTRPIKNRSVTFPGSDTGADLNSYLTIAPDWEGIPANATYRLSVAGAPARVIATTPFVRLLPAQLFDAAGVALTPGVSRTISLTYSANAGLHTIAQSTFQLTFGPPAPSSRIVLPPHVPPVVTGTTIPVTYDLRGYPSALLAAPALNVSLPGTASTGFIGIGLYPAYSTPLTSTHGTVDVPVSALAGAGTYTLWIDLQPGLTTFNSDISDLAFTRVDAGTARPPAPLLSLAAGGPPVHTLTVPYKSPFRVAYDVSHVPRATGAIVELSAPPPSPFFYESGLGVGLNTVRNPNGNTLDDDGVVTGAIYHVAASGTAGTVTIDPEAAKIPATTSVNVRVLPTSGGTPVAEAGDAGTIVYSGIDTVLGGGLQILYMNPAGSDGYLVEGGVFGTPSAGTPLYALEPFDLATGTVTGIPISFNTSNLISLPFVQNDTVVAVSSQDFTTLNYVRASPPAAGFSTFSFPPGSIPASALVVAAGPDSAPTRSAYLAVDLASGAVLATRGDVTTGNGFAPGVDVTALLGPNADSAGEFALSYDPNTDRAYLLIEDATLPCDQQSPKLLTVDFTTGTASARDLGIGGGSTNLGTYGYQMALDPSTHVAAVATTCHTFTAGTDGFRAELSLVDLGTGAVKRVYQHVLGPEHTFHGYPFMIGGDSATIGIDSVNHLVLQRSMFCPVLMSSFDPNARPCLNLYDESGRLAKTVPRLFGDGFADPGVNFNGVNPSTRTGVAMGQLAYQFYIVSYDVQPYTY